MLYFDRVSKEYENGTKVLDNISDYPRGGLLVLTGEGAPKKAVRASTGSMNKSTVAYKPRNHANDYELRNQNQLMKEAIAYSIKQSFKENQKIQHPKFGLGFVTKVLPDRVDVIFNDEVRTLIHNKN